MRRCARLMGLAVAVRSRTSSSVTDSVAESHRQWSKPLPGPVSEGTLAQHLARVRQRLVGQGAQR